MLNIVLRILTVGLIAVVLTGCGKSDAGKAAEQAKLADQLSEKDIQEISAIGNFDDQTAKLVELGSKKLKEFASRGNNDAQKLVLTMYDPGRPWRGIKHDDVEYVALVHKYAEQGGAPAQYRLAELYAGLQGDSGIYPAHGVPVDAAKAAEWTQKAAAQGYADAQLSLGHKYHYGGGVPKDDAKSQEWYQKAKEQYLKASEQGDSNASHRLMVIYSEGWGVPKDKAKAKEWQQIEGKQYDLEHPNSILAKMRKQESVDKLPKKSNMSLVLSYSADPFAFREKMVGKNIETSLFVTAYADEGNTAKLVDGNTRFYCRMSGSDFSSIRKTIGSRASIVVRGILAVDRAGSQDIGLDNCKFISVDTDWKATDD